jgi:peptidoglycan/xylan/chitin deacetylase (PgdA/CDA1 family)
MGIPDNTSTASVLDTLRDSGVHSTFFVTGEWVEASPELARRMVEEGHELANHSYDHPYFTRISDERILWQLERTDQLVREVVGVEPAPYFRPPFGAYDRRVLRVLGQAGYYVLYWSLDPSDWRPEATTESVVRRVVGLTQPGEVVIFHGYVPKTARALPVIIERLREQGLCFGTVTDLLR